MAKRKSGEELKGGFYRTYRWGGDHDPIIDQIKTLMEDDGVSVKEVSNNSGVTTGTLMRWFDGGTRKPQHPTIKAVVRAIGPYDYAIVHKPTGKVVSVRRKK